MGSALKKRKTATKPLRISSFAAPCRFLALPLLAFALILSPCRQADAEFTLSDEMELGRRFNLLIRSSSILIQDPEVVDYGEYLLRRLLEKIPPQPFRFSLSVIHDNTPNAFAVPGGYIFIHTGLILVMRHESEVAGVLAHELAHITQRHMADRIEKSQRVSLLSLVSTLAGVFLGGGKDAGAAMVVGGLAAGQAAMLSYSRADEASADQVGMTYFLNAGYPPEGMVNAFRYIQHPQWVTGSNIPTYLSTHPDISARITDLTARIGNMPKRSYDTGEEDKRFLRIQTLIRGRYATPETALQFFEEQAKGPHRELANLGLGILYERLNRIPEAEKAFAGAVKALPDDQIVLREAGRFNYLKGDRNTAIQLLQRATAKNPHDYLALFYYARLLADAGQQEQAMDCYKQILRYQPEDAETHYYYAQSLGNAHLIFQAYLHLAYSSLYENSPRKTDQAYQRLKNMAETDADKEELTLFEKRYAERRVYWQ
jgi:predicted Zn-dependent protease